MSTRFKVRTQLLSLAAFFMVMLLGLGLIGVQQSLGAAEQLRTVYEDRVVPLKQLKVVADMYAVNIVDAAHKTRDGALTPSQGLAALREARQRVADEWKAYAATTLVDREKELVTRIRPLFEAADASVARLEAIMKAGDLNALRAYAATEMYPVMDPLQGVISDLVQVQLDVAKAVYEDGVGHVGVMFAVVGGAALAAALAGGLLALRIAGGLGRALGAEPWQVKQVAEAVALGHLNHAVAVRPGDSESVMAAMQHMRDRLAHIVATVRGNAECVASASTQISQGNLDLSNRTENQASTLEETASSMEEIHSTVQHNATSASQAEQLARGANTTAGEGGQIVQQVVNTMQEIDQASRQIVEIISVIDGIAFQTNILALNAAVEAARAGEQGRGFAVVAGEVRVLAQRSAEAARQIKTLIGANAQRVQAGSELVAHAGTSMQNIVQSIRRVTDIVGEISTASKEQAAGVAQVAAAVQHLDRNTQQNAALVEESAAAAENLRLQAEQLVAAVAVFRLAADAGEERAPPAAPQGPGKAGGMRGQPARQAAAPVRQPALA